MAVLVVSEHQDGRLRDASLRVVTAAQQLSDDVDVLVAGASVQNVAGEAAAIAGVRKVLVVESEPLGHGLAEAYETAVLSLIGQYDVVMFPATAHGKNVAPRLAAKLDVAPISDVVAVIAEDTFVRPIYAGAALETIRSSDSKKVITVRTTAFGARGLAGQAPVETIAPPPSNGRAHFVRQELIRSERPDLGSASIVVSGGRALGSAEEFQRVIGPLADRLGAAVGASRAAVDAGYAPNDCQVGQTGKIVAPDLYIAVGISGAIQHLAGMKESKVIVAINKDPDAPIFHVADYGLVADYRTAIAELMAAL